MKKLLTISFVLASLHLFAAEPIKVSSEIKQATVYLKGAVLKNKATADIPAGQSTIVFTGLSYDVLRESIRINPTGCQILSVTTKKNYLNLEQLNDEVKKMQEEVQKLQAKNKDNTDLLSVYENEKQLVQSNQYIGGKNNGVDPEKLKAMSDFYRQRLQEILDKTQAIKSDIKKNNTRITELTKQINQSASKNIYPTSEIEINITAERATTAQFDIEYFINEAGWFPAYDFRVNDLATPMQIDYVAHIYQNSGLDWKNVEVSVSSADPGNNTGMPVLQKWNISKYNSKLDYYTQQPLTDVNKISGEIVDNTGLPIPFATIRVENSSVGVQADVDGRFTLVLPSGSKSIIVSSVGFNQATFPITSTYMKLELSSSATLQAVTISSEVSGGVFDMERTQSRRATPYQPLREADDKNGRILSTNASSSSNTVSFEYTLKEKMNIPSDGRPYTAQIMSREVDAKYKHFASPKITRDVYLSIFIPEWEKLNLLEGEVNLYFANSYTGKSVISMRDLKDSLEFSLGKDPNVKVQRTLTYQKTTGGGIMPNKTGTYKWTTELRNVSSKPITITVTEPFPMATDKEIEVELAKELSGAKVDAEKGLLTWEITLQPNEQKKLDFGFSVTYPKNLNMRFE